MNKTLRSAAAGAALLAAATLASANSTTVTVDSMLNSVVGGVALDTGVALTNGEQFTVTVPTNEIWNNSWGDANYDANANGNGFQWMQLGNLNATIGALVGQVGNGDYFVVGTNFSGTANGSGDLNLYYWDSDSFNNIGAVHATITAVPEPATFALMGLGLVAVALRRRQA